MQQQLSVITLGVQDLAAARRFYLEGFGWTPAFENDEVVFFQMNGFVLGLWLRAALETDAQRTAASGPPPFALAHNVLSADEVDRVIAHLAAHGGQVLRSGDAPPHGGYRGYVADPDGFAWEIAWNPAWGIDADGHVTFGL